jgi:hypothetical protein
MRDIWPEWDSDQKKWLPETAVFYTIGDILDSDIEEAHSGPVTPDWVKWKSMRGVSVRTAVSLALNLNPDIFDVFSMDMAPKQYSNLLEISESLHFLRKNQLGFRMVDLVEYGKYAEDNLRSHLSDGNLPQEFPRDDSKTPKQTVLRLRNVASDQSMNTCDNPDVPPYMTSKLRALFQIMRELPPNDTINLVNTLMDITGLKKRDASTLASLINRKIDMRANFWKCEAKEESGA